MCEQCCAQADGWGEFLSGWFLCRANKDGHEMSVGDWGLVECNDPTFIFRTTPVLDPLSGLSDDEINSIPMDSPISRQNDLFIDTSQKIGSEMAETYSSDVLDDDYSWALFDAYLRLYEAMKLEGYNREKDGSPNAWLCNHIAKFLEKQSEPAWKCSFESKNF